MSNFSFLLYTSLGLLQAKAMFTLAFYRTRVPKLESILLRNWIFLIIPIPAVRAELELNCLHLNWSQNCIIQNWIQNCLKSSKYDTSHSYILTYKVTAGFGLHRVKCLLVIQERTAESEWFHFSLSWFMARM